MITKQYIKALPHGAKYSLAWLSKVFYYERISEHTPQGMEEGPPEHRAAAEEHRKAMPLQVSQDYNQRD